VVGITDDCQGYTAEDPWQNLPPRMDTTRKRVSPLDTAEAYSFITSEDTFSPELVDIGNQIEELECCSTR
jgi:hypothetical protein